MPMPSNLVTLDAFKRELTMLSTDCGTTLYRATGDLLLKKYKKIDEVKEGAVVALADNPATKRACWSLWA